MMKMEAAQEVARHVESINWIDREILLLTKQDQKKSHNVGWLTNHSSEAFSSAQPSADAAREIRAILRRDLTNRRNYIQEQLRRLQVEA